MPGKKASKGPDAKAGSEKTATIGKRTPPTPADIEIMLKRAKKPSEDAMVLHPFYKGKIEISLKCPVRTFKDFAIWYTPGVAQPCLDIKAHPETVYDHTNKANSIAVVSDGTRVLGLGDIGPEAAMPVMEGKALLFKYLGGVDAVPICLGTKDPEAIIETVKLLQPSFGGINLEDISQPKCFYILERLRKEATIPVWHDDQQGTATITLAGVMNALKVVGKSKKDATIVMVGAGAANVCIGNLLQAWGIVPRNMMYVDSKGLLGPHRKDIEQKASNFKEKWVVCTTTNGEGRQGDLSVAMRGADLVVACSTPGPGVIKKEWVRSMATDAIVMACANPVPEIWPWEAEEAGARIIATGRSDFPNQINNSLGFPGIFRGTLDVMASTITDEMCIAAAGELAILAEEQGLSETHIVPNMDDWEVFPREAAAVGMKAISQGIARRKDLTRDALLEMAKVRIKRARDMTKDLMANKEFIPKAPV